MSNLECMEPHACGHDCMKNEGHADDHWCLWCDRVTGEPVGAPTTMAGRHLLANVKPTYTPPGSGKDFRHHILAIEAEASAPVDARELTVEVAARIFHGMDCGPIRGEVAPPKPHEPNSSSYYWCDHMAQRFVRELALHGPTP